MRTKLIRKYRKLFEGPHAFPSVGDGWMSLIECFLEKIVHDMKYNHMPPVTITQIKEKFGMLTIYHSGGNDATLSYAIFAGQMSLKMCEICGTTYNMGMTLGHLQAICKDCFEAWSKSPAAAIRWYREWKSNGKIDTNEQVVKQLLK